MAEDARIITVKKIEEEQLANERQAGVDREARAESATGCRAIRDRARRTGSGERRGSRRRRKPSAWRASMTRRPRPRRPKRTG